MRKRKPNTNTKKRNRHTDEGQLLPGIRKTRGIRKKLMGAQREGAPEQELEQLRLALKKSKAAGKGGS